MILIFHAQIFNTRTSTEKWLLEKYYTTHIHRFNLILYLPPIHPSLVFTCHIPYKFPFSYLTTPRKRNPQFFSRKKISHFLCSIFSPFLSNFFSRFFFSRLFQHSISIYVYRFHHLKVEWWCFLYWILKWFFFNIFMLMRFFKEYNFNRIMIQFVNLHH